MTLSERNEASTRTELIDTQLARAGWSRNRRTLIEEFLLKTGEPDSTYGNEQFADYVLLGSDGKPIAIVEAKRSARDEIAGKRQAADYADAIKAKFGDDPFIFLTNGKEIQFWDRDRSSGIATVIRPGKLPASTPAMTLNACDIKGNTHSPCMR